MHLTEMAIPTPELLNLCLWRDWDWEKIRPRLILGEGCLPVGGFIGEVPKRRGHRGLWDAGPE